VKLAKNYLYGAELLCNWISKKKLKWNFFKTLQIHIYIYVYMFTYHGSEFYGNITISNFRRTCSHSHGLGVIQKRTYALFLNRDDAVYQSWYLPTRSFYPFRISEIQVSNLRVWGVRTFNTLCVEARAYRELQPPTQRIKHRKGRLNRKQERATICVNA